jgi:glutathione synthase/RimK-type ligase-like ATP-grasp enzyme
MAKVKAFRPQIRSRHPSHSELRSKNGKRLPLLPFKSVIRFGSTTEIEDTLIKGGKRIELNTTTAIKNSSSKLLMKECFKNNKVVTAIWSRGTDIDNIVNDLQSQLDEGKSPFPVISKSLYGSRGRGNIKHDTIEDLKKWSKGNSINMNNYIFEKFYNFTREYRLHVNKDGCFYTCRKMLKKDTPDNKKWFRNDVNSVWILENNADFDRPVNWKNVVKESVNALNAVGLDFGAVDLRIQGSSNNKGTKREEPQFIVVEINSAPSFGDITKQKYIEEIPKMLLNKFNNG